MGEKLTWEEIQERYPDMWLGLTDVEYVNDDGVTIESAVVKYADKTKDELGMLAFAGDIISRHTAKYEMFQIGAVDLFI